MCVNDGECLSNGTCKCKTGFSGITCQECKYFLIFLTYFNFFIIQVKGCNMGGLLTCLNNGKCLKTGFCDCMAGFSGQICTECELFKFTIRVL